MIGFAAPKISAGDASNQGTGTISLLSAVRDAVDPRLGVFNNHDNCPFDRVNSPLGPSVLGSCAVREGGTC